MARKYRVKGNLAIKTPAARSGETVVWVPEFRGNGQRPAPGVPRTEVEELLDNFEGEPFAETPGERNFAIGTVIVSCAVFLVLAVLPIF